MRKTVLVTGLLLAACVAGFFTWSSRQAGKTAAADSAAGHLHHWDAARAAAYMDMREVYWQGWGPAQKEQGTVCISCHTVIPYAMARPALRNAVHETGASAPEKFMIGSVEKRVQYWKQMAPFYSEQVGPGKAAQSRATEAVLNAVILASYDARQESLRPVTRTAFDEAWALQESSGEIAGGWKWQDFHLAPWESSESAYQGAALLAGKMESAPDGYANGPDARQHLNRLWDYLERGYSSQPVINKVYVLWASARSPRPLSPQQRTTLLHTLENLQQPDGGWSLMSMDQAADQAPQSKWHWALHMAAKSPPSDGCATGLAVLVLEESGTDQQDPTLQRGLEWLRQHQNTDGSWSAASLNKKRNPETNVGHFMTDAATGYAVLALEQSHEGGIFSAASSDPMHSVAGAEKADLSR